MKKTTRLLTLLSVIILFSSCASKFRALKPETQEFSHVIDTGDLLIEYNPNLLKYSKNKKIQKKADKKHISLIIAKFTNKSSNPIDIPKDIVFNNDILNTDYSYKKLKQKPWTYYIALISAGFNFSSEGSSGSIGINPLALIYSIPNSIIASVANKKMKKELNNYSLENKILAPNESKYGLITFDNSNNSVLNIETVKGIKVNSKTNSSKYGSLLIENCIAYDKQKYNSYEEYRRNLIQCLEKSKLANNVTPFERKHKNGKYKVLGINAKHQFGRNSNYLYKVGTWAFYNEDGTIKKLIKYDVNGKEIMR